MREKTIVAKEEQAEFESSGAFYNPHMKICRDVSSLAVGALGGKLQVLDGFCASGIRGIRYAKENANVKSVTFLDISEKAVALARKNAMLNGLESAAFAKDDFNSFLFTRSFDFVEIDPFGSPAPFLYHAIRSFRRMKQGFLSVTATDAAVLCGASPNACLKYYQAKPLDNELCHEIGARILLGKIARTACEFNFGVAPLFTLSKRHFFKIMARLERGADGAVETAKNSLGFLFQCQKCLAVEAGKKPFGVAGCKKCGSANLEWAGPLWVGEIQERKTLQKMIALNEKRGYENKEKLGELLQVMKGEAGFPPGFLDLHKLAEKTGKGPESTDAFVQAMNEKGIRAARTHFRPTGVKLSGALQLKGLS